MSIEIIKLPRERFNEACALIWEVFQVFEVPDFEPQGVTEYKRRLDIVENEKGITFYAAIENGAVVGVLGACGAFIRYFYVKQSHHKMGIGKMLFNELLNETSESITVRACPYGVKVYTRLGFVPTDTVQNDMGIIYTPMMLKR